MGKHRKRSYKNISDIHPFILNDRPWWSTEQIADVAGYDRPGIRTILRNMPLKANLHYIKLDDSDMRRTFSKETGYPGSIRGNYVFILSSEAVEILIPHLKITKAKDQLSELVKDMKLQVQAIVDDTPPAKTIAEVLEETPEETQVSFKESVAFERIGSLLSELHSIVNDASMEHISQFLELSSVKKRIEELEIENAALRGQVSVFQKDAETRTEIGRMSCVLKFPFEHYEKLYNKLTKKNVKGNGLLPYYIPEILKIDSLKSQKDVMEYYRQLGIVTDFGGRYALEGKYNGEYMFKETFYENGGKTVIAQLNGFVYIIASLVQDGKLDEHEFFVRQEMYKR